MEFLSRFVSRYITPIAGNWSEKNSCAAYGFGRGRGAVRWSRKQGFLGGGSMEGMHRRSSWHGSPTGVGSRWTIVERNRDSCSDAENSGLVRAVARRIVAVERSASPRSSCVITFSGNEILETKSSLLFSRFSRINIELPSPSRSISSSRRINCATDLTNRRNFSSLRS